MFHRRLTEETFRTIVRPHLGKLHRIAVRWTGDPGAAEDLVQELVTRLWQKPGRLGEARSQEAWLVRALYHLYVDMVRRDSRRPENGALELNEEVLEGEAAVRASAEGAWRTQRVLRSIAALPLPQRTVVVLHDMEGYSLDETARLVGVRTGTVKSRLGRAHKHLRDVLSGNVSASGCVLEGEVSNDAMSTV